MSYPYQNEDRKFLHDLATLLMIARTLAKKAVSELCNLQSIGDKEPIIQKLQKILESLDEVQNLHADQKVAISNRS